MSSQTVVVAPIVDGRFQRDNEVAAGEPAVELIAGRRRSGYGETVGRGPVGERPVEGQRADDGGGVTTVSATL